MLFICAHNDDQIVGAGGALAKYAKEGKKVRTIIFSFGRESHPHFKRDVIIEARIKESLAADKLLGGSGVAYLGIDEGRFPEQIEQRNIKAKLAWIIKQEKPIKIFTHSIDDPHPDHRAVHHAVDAIARSENLKCDIYSFDVWNPFNVRHRDKPKLVVDITDTFELKLKAFETHKSQKLARFSLLWNVYFKAILNGWTNNCRYAEVFIKLH